jgi:poly(3-hydroxybutyrate) depolymerase
MVNGVRYLTCLFVCAALACGEDSQGSAPNGAAGSGAASAGQNAGGAQNPSGGMAMAGSTSGGMSLGGNAGSGGASGGAGQAGQGGQDTGPKRSMGCGKAGSMTGERQMSVAGFTGLYIVSVPDDYDADQAYPLGFGFHGRNRNHQNCHDGDCAGFQNVLGNEAILVYMQSLRNPTNNTQGGWESMSERDGNAEFFEEVSTLVKNEFCVDEKQVFVAGTSSGASFANLLACRYGDQLLAVGPVSGGLPENQDCKGKPAAVVIHGIDDPHVQFSAGETARDHYLQRNGCMSESEPPVATMHADIRAKRDAEPSVEDEGCVDYEGCGAGSPVRWCEHSFGGYDGSTHGWPPTGGQMIWDFVQSLR